MDPKLNSLLKWSIQNSETGDNNNNNTNTTATNNPNNVVESASRGLNPEVLSSLFGGPSDADLMKAAMGALYSPDVDLENKMVAFDNFEQLIESLDNANNMESLGLWTPLVQLLEHEEADMRRMAAWCVGTAVQNNEKSQDKVVVLNVLPTLVKMATSDPAPAARKKAVYAISSSVRNYQPALDELVKHLPDGYPHDKVDAGDMEAIDGIMDKLRAHPASA